MFLLYANLKNCRFHQEEVLILGYVVFSKGICMENEGIKAIKQSQSVQNIQVFLGFVNFYCQFIQRFSQITISFTLMLKISGNTKSLI